MINLKSPRLPNGHLPETHRLAYRNEWQFPGISSNWQRSSRSGVAISKSTASTKRRLCLAVTPTVPILLGEQVLNPLPLIITKSRAPWGHQIHLKKEKGFCPRRTTPPQKIKYLSDSEPYISEHVRSILRFLPISTYSSKNFLESLRCVKDELPT